MCCRLWGALAKFQLSRYKSLLSLCDEALEIADRIMLKKGNYVRYLINLESEQDQVELIQQIIQQNLTC
jgi:hypothetical protein